MVLFKFTFGMYSHYHLLKFNITLLCNQNYIISKHVKNAHIPIYLVCTSNRHHTIRRAVIDSIDIDSSIHILKYQYIGLKYS